MSQLVCSQCEALYESSDRFCEFCGQPFYHSDLSQPVAFSTFSAEMTRSARSARSALAAAPATGTTESTDTVVLILQNGKQFKLHDGHEFWVGRSDPASGWYPAIDLSGHGGLDGGVSRKHSRIIVQGSRLFVEDNGSSNGTTLNGTQLTLNRRYAVQSGDRLCFGQVYARVKTND